MHTATAQPDDYGNDYTDPEAWRVMRDGWSGVPTTDLDCRAWLKFDASHRQEGASDV